jgi:signal transduction histidine kinase
MKTTAFLIRVSICFLLSLIPVSEFENKIYSTRLQTRLKSGRTPDVVLIDIPSHDFYRSTSLKAIEAQLKQKKPRLILVNMTHSWHHLIIDSDGIVRRATLRSKGQPSLSYTAAQRLHLDSQRLKATQEPHLINYLGPAGTFPRCRWPPLETEGCPSLQNQILLLSEENNEYPTFQTPVGEMSPQEVIANDIQTLVKHEMIHTAPLLVIFLILLGMIIIAAFYILYFPVLINSIAIVSTGILVVIFGFQIIFQLWSVYIPSANCILALLITYLVFTGYRLAIQENLQWRNLKQAQYLKELDRMKTNFLTLMSHDLKTPLAKIQAVAERMRREIQLPPDQRSDWRELIDSIENSNNELKRFITSVLNLSKIESQKVILNKKSNDINFLIKQTLKRLRPLAQQKNIAIIENLEPLFSIECDEDLMLQVLTNLIDNAIKYSPTHSRIIVRSQEEEGFVRVEVEDFGPGIPKDQLPLMFRKFSRFLRPAQEQVKGTGLGLYLSKYFIELHGGSIRVKSIEGQGTTFSFTLPLQGAESEVILG